MHIGQIALTVHDPERAAAFYADVLGFPLLFRAGLLSFFDIGGVRLMLSPPDRPESVPSGSVLYFKVPELEGRVQELEDRGVSFIDEPHLIARMPDHELWMTFFKDTEGNTLALMCEKRQ